MRRLPSSPYLPSSVSMFSTAGRLERLEPVPLVDVGDDVEHVRAAADVLREEVAHAAGGLS